MSSIEITDIKDVREGDEVTLSVFGHEFTGKAWGDIDGLRVGGSYFNRPYVTIVRATREVPDLPTEPGSVIMDATIRGTTGVKAYLGAGAAWYTDQIVGGYWWGSPSDITAWKPGRIVEAEDSDD